MEPTATEPKTVLVINPRLSRLHDLEAVINQHLDGPWVIGESLAEVQSTRLYRESHPTFEAWIKERFGMSRPRAYQLIGAVKTRALLSTRLDSQDIPLPTNEGQIRILAPFTPDEQVDVWTEAVALADDGDVAEKHVKRAIRERRRAARVERLVDISRGNQEIGEGGTYSVVLADPPWQYDDGTTDPTRVIENQYPTMPLDEICALKVGESTTDDAVLFLWATGPLLPEALEVMKAWGFRYISGAVWSKLRMGKGYWFRVSHEHLLVGIKGNPPRPPPSALVDSVITAKRGEHSAKPVEVYEIIESYYPELARVELFARQTREGWSAWGNQAG
ncbi:MAG: MT-A70 family methyltransferase [bacterium]